ncbi:MAG TPA: insulinase family protein [Caproiciproducens sp.]|nr:insulinase family protein [Caproiciproducens sp.]
MVEIEQRSVCNGVNFRSIKDTKFKTVRLSVNFMLPLQKSKAAANAILPFLLSRASREYPDFTKLGERLEELYGAQIDADVQKFGDVQLLTVSASGIADRYALNGESVSTELSDLLCSIIFDPPLENGLFQEEGFEQERRQTIELIDSEYNDKRSYAKLRCEQIMCANERYGINRYGSKEEIQALKLEELTDAWRYLLQNAKIEILALGDCNTARVYDGFFKAFQRYEKAGAADCVTTNIKRAEKVNETTEKMDVAQSKLVMGFRTSTAVPDKKVSAVKLMAALYGGTPSSKLFLNVREKLSLCYYCSAQYNSMKGIMLVQSGVETKNVDRAKEEIIIQLDEIKKGNFSDEELVTAKLALCNSYRTVCDSLGALEAWYLSQTFSNEVLRPEEAVADIQAITRQDIIDAANDVTLDTVYRLIGSGENVG